MDYSFQFAPVIDQLPYLLGGALVTLQIAFFSFWGGALIGVFGALAKVYGGPASRKAASSYVTALTNTPALVQIFLLYYALPDAGMDVARGLDGGQSRALWFQIDLTGHDNVEGSELVQHVTYTAKCMP